MQWRYAVQKNWGNTNEKRTTNFALTQHIGLRRILFDDQGCQEGGTAGGTKFPGPGTRQKAQQTKKKNFYWLTNITITT